MKKTLSVVAISVALAALAGCNKQNNTISAANFDANKLAQTIEKSLKDKGDNVTVKVEELKKLNKPAGYSYVELTYTKDGEQVAQYKVFTDGQVISQDFIDVETLTPMSSDLDFETAKAVNIPTDNLTLVAGKKDSKNIIIEVTDFQCPYCKKANTYFVDKLKDKKDYALYIVHLPLQIHPSAEKMAHIFEAGMLMGKNFANELFAEDYDVKFENLLTKLQKEKGDAMPDFEADIKPLIDQVNTELVNEYAAKSGDEAKFRELLDSDLVKNKFADSQNIVNQIKAQSTPMFIINGKTVTGYDVNRLEKVLSEIK